MNKIEGWMGEEELDFLHKIAKKMNSVVEIGSYQGRSTVALLESGTKVTAIDTWKGNKELVVKKKDYKEFLKNIAKYSNLTIIVGESVKTSKQFDKVDMVFIDGDHTYKGVKRDIKAWLHKTTKLICGHDYDFEEVQRAVDEFFKVDGVIGSIWYKKLR